MEAKFNISQNRTDDCLELKLTGQIDEDSDFGAIDFSKSKEVNFDFEKIKMINSCGIREWIKFLGIIPKEVNISYIRCPQILIEQMNMVHGFVPANAKIKSFFAPYFCEKCDQEHKILIEAQNVKDDHAPETKCPACSEPMEFDALEKQYFQFIHRKN